MDPRTVELVEALCFHADWICSDTQAEKEVKVTGGCCRGGGAPWQRQCPEAQLAARRPEARQEALQEGAPAFLPMILQPSKLPREAADDWCILQGLFSAHVLVLTINVFKYHEYDLLY